MTALLEVRDVTKRFGGLSAVDSVSLSLDAGTVLGLIGPNGSGKTTLLSVLAGTLPPSSGTVLLDGSAVSGRGPRHCVRAGVNRTFQTTRLFPSWTLRQSMHLAERESDRRRPTRRFDAPEICAALALDDSLDRQCGALSNATQRLAMIAVALSSGPAVLLLDEPAVGMNVSETATLADAIRRVRDGLGIAVVVVEHNMHFLMPLADAVTVMASGRVLATGSPAEVRANEAVIATYLGS